MATPRDEIKSTFRFYRRDALPGITKESVTSNTGRTFRNVATKWVADKSVNERSPVTVVNGRTHLPGGKDAWKLEEHGFCYIKTPDYVFEEHQYQDRRRVNKEFGPKVAEAVRKAAGAKQAFWLSHQRRAENGTPVERYAKDLPHSDYGPEYEAQCREMLHHRYGMPEEEAQTCGLCLMNLWCPVERPAYKWPLCLLDASSVDMETETARFLAADPRTVDNGYGYYNGKDNTNAFTQQGTVKTADTGRGPRPKEERVPQPGADAPALVPLYAPHHRFVYLTDMQPNEAAVFKQIDFRKGAKAKATFHCAVDDPFHKNWKECPGRRSIECRVLLIYDPDTPSAKL